MCHGTAAWEQELSCWERWADCVPSTLDDGNQREQRPMVKTCQPQLTSTETNKYVCLLIYPYTVSTYTFGIQCDVYGAIPRLLKANGGVGFLFYFPTPLLPSSGPLNSYHLFTHRHWERHTHISATSMALFQQSLPEQVSLSINVR